MNIAFFSILNSTVYVMLSGAVLEWQAVLNVWFKTGNVLLNPENQPNVAKIVSDKTQIWFALMGSAH